MDKDKEICELKKQVYCLQKHSQALQEANKEHFNHLIGKVLVPIEEYDRLKITINKLDNELEKGELEERIEELQLENTTWEEVSRAQGFKLEIVRDFLAKQTHLHFAQMLVRIIDMEVDTEIMS